MSDLDMRDRDAGPQIHPSAVVAHAAQLGRGVQIGPFCVVGPDVVLGEGVRLVSHVAVAGHTTIGAGTRVFPFASLGHEPQDLKFRGEVSELRIGRDCLIREGVTMNPGTAAGGLLTSVGDRSVFLAQSHVAHDCRVGDDVIFSNNVMLAGHCTVGDHAILGGGAAVHQFVRIGRHCFIGGLAGVEHDVIPYGIALGNRAHLAGLNVVGLKRRGFSREVIHDLRRAYRRCSPPRVRCRSGSEAVAAEFGRHAAGRTRSSPSCATAATVPSACRATAATCREPSDGAPPSAARLHRGGRAFGRPARRRAACDALRERAPGLGVAGVGGDAMARRGPRVALPAVRHRGDGLRPGPGAPAATSCVASGRPPRPPWRPDPTCSSSSTVRTSPTASRGACAGSRPGIPIVDYVSPTVWAWRPGRAPAMRAYVDHLLALLPFEPEAHGRLGGPPCTYVGHPLIERLDELRPGPDDGGRGRAAVPPGAAGLAPLRDPTPDGRVRRGRGAGGAARAGPRRRPAGGLRPRRRDRRPGRGLAGGAPHRDGRGRPSSPPSAAPARRWRPPAP